MSDRRLHKMNQDTLERFQRVMFAKFGWQVHSYPTYEEALKAIIGGVIADTSLLYEGVVTLEEWEEAVKVAS